MNVLDEMRDLKSRVAVLEARDAAKDKKLAAMQRQIDKTAPRGLAWLQQNRSQWPTMVAGFKLPVTQAHFDDLVEHDFFVAWAELFTTAVPIGLPFCALREQPGVIYAFTGGGWAEMSRADLVAFFTRTQAAFGPFMDEWETEHAAEIRDNHPAIHLQHKKLTDVGIAYFGDAKWFVKLRDIMYECIHDAPT